MFRVGIVGVGMVGNAVKEGFGELVVSCYDKFKKDLCVQTEDLYDTDFLFVCVPTPTKNGEQDLSEVHNAVRAAHVYGYKGIVVVKSTVIPGTMDKLSKMYPDLRLVHNPEFLTERNAVNDFKHQQCILISGLRKDTEEVFNLYGSSDVFFGNMYISEKYLSTEWAKYIHNCILPVQLSFLNEVYKVINDEKIYEEASFLAYKNGNMSRHYKVPGPDGKFGWGGSCFTKDTEALAYAFPDQLPTLVSAIISNRKVRK